MAPNNYSVVLNDDFGSIDVKGRKKCISCKLYKEAASFNERIAFDTCIPCLKKRGINAEELKEYQ